MAIGRTSIPTNAPSSDSRIGLTPIKEGDLPVLFRWINDRALVELSSEFKPVSPTEHREWFDRIQQRPDVRIFAIRRAGGSNPIGTCQLLNIDRVKRNAELQIRIGETEARGQGLGTEAVRQLVEFGFRELSLRRISLHVFVTNTAAQRAYEKAGFVREGIIKDAALVEGKKVDAVVMAILND